MAKEPLFKIDPDSEVVGGGHGQVYVTTTPNHPPSSAGKKMPDHDKTYVAKHTVIMENHLGRLLKDDEEVHHKDEDPSNNVLSNLVLTSREDHQRDHAKKRKFWKKSPRTKPGKKRKAALRVIEAFLNSSLFQ
jgi:hypothetical protein